MTSKVVRMASTATGAFGMNDLAIVRAIHVLAVVIWIGGLAMATTVILPTVRRAPTPAEGNVERMVIG